MRRRAATATDTMNKSCTPSSITDKKGCSDCRGQDQPSRFLAAVLRAVARSLLLTILWSVGASGVERITVNDIRTPADLPYTVFPADAWIAWEFRRALPQPVLVYRRGVPDSLPAQYISVYNGDSTQFATAQIGLLTYPGRSPLLDRGADLILTDCRAYRDSALGTMSLVAAGIRSDSVVVVWSNITGPPEIRALKAVRDSTGDLRWDGQAMVRGLVDYDFDGVLEAFIAVQAGRDLQPRGIIRWLGRKRW